VGHWGTVHQYRRAAYAVLTAAFPLLQSLMDEFHRPPAAVIDVMLLLVMLSHSLRTVHICDNVAAIDASAFRGGACVASVSARLRTELYDLA
jgi:hypothetical protein